VNTTYGRPVGGGPCGRAVEDVAHAPVLGHGLGALVALDDHGRLAQQQLGHTLHLAGLGAYAAGPGALGELRHLPPRRARDLVARPRQRLRLRRLGAQPRVRRTAVLDAFATVDYLLSTCKYGIKAVLNLEIYGNRQTN